MRSDIYFAPNSDLTGEFHVLSNGGTSTYNAFQAEYRHRLSHGLQTLLSYTWAHCIDNVSSDGNFANVRPGVEPASRDRGPSDYDIRHTFSRVVSYDIPQTGSGVLKQIFGNWSTDSIVYVRSAPPANVVTGQNLYPITLLPGSYSVQRPNIVPGVPFYLHPAARSSTQQRRPCLFPPQRKAIWGAMRCTDSGPRNEFLAAARVPIH